MTIKHMAYQPAMEIIICTPTTVRRFVKKMRCPNCKKDRAFLCEFQEWYGWDQTCLNCGDRWEDGEICPRPLERGWRQKSVQRALDRLDLPVEKSEFNLDDFHPYELKDNQ